MNIRSIAAVTELPGNMRVAVTSVAKSAVEKIDYVSIEEPLEIRLSYLVEGKRLEQTIAVTMRTPGHDLDLAVGFLHGEGILQSPKDCEAVEHCGPPSPDKQLQNVVRVRLADRCPFDPDLLTRHFYTTSSCGICGKASLESVSRMLPKTPVVGDFHIADSMLRGLPRQLREVQREFEKTGGLHASATFDEEGQIIRMREDVGRHNALDKLVGSYCREGSLDDLEGLGLLLSGRSSFELVQKAGVARMPLIAAIGPPSSLAIELASELDITLIGFLKAHQYNVYNGDRVQND